MAPKNKKKNSFYFFMVDVQVREEAKGRRIPMKSIAQYAHPLWVKLSPAEKQKYEDQAIMYKNNSQLQGKKFASDGTLIEDNLRCLEEAERRENEQLQEIKTYINSNGIPKEQFIEFASKRVLYFISFNILCQTEKEYIPIEVGIVEYSIEHGIHRELSMLIHTGPVPTGYTGEALRHSRDEHEINVFQGEENSVRDMRKVYQDIKKFVNPYDSEEYPPLFCNEDSIKKNIGCLEWLAKKAGERETFDIWNAKYLLLELRAGAEEPLPSITIAYDLLNKASFNYHSEARCDFHEEKDCQNCALAYSKRLCYLLSDAVCPVFDIQVTEKHIPSRSLENKEYEVYKPNDNPKLDKYFEPRSYRSDQRNYHENSRVEGQFSDTPDDSKQPSNVPRQPASSCIAEEMSRLKLNMTSATVPGHGIGRGQRWK
ncbi:protein maelstrom-like protein [Trichonephila inaurata madagascariensis]|uniref:Protein maelstrom-like protein n=1 Tax=Trichonephila inaurata madagascariensis TaxID=2747483 RepID=A0A8X7C1Z6_9ARAC|nr:protein maelstrom-like protein [Trichonephila inaurata madagascariensis]